MTTFVLYHGNCFDGIAAAWVVNRFLNQEDPLNESPTQYIAMNYGTEYEQLDKITESLKNANLIIVDFSFKRQTMELLHAVVGNMIVIDHHKTAQKECEGLPFCKFDMNESGASLAWKHYFPEQLVPKLVQYVADRDLWRFSLPYSEVVNAWIQSYPMTIQAYEDMNHWLEKMPFGDTIRQGEAILRYKDAKVEQMCETASLQDIGGYIVPVANASVLFSEVGHALCKKYPNAPFSAYYFDRLGDGIRQWGLRSIGDFDVSVVARTNGGGGHKNAAGFQVELNEA